MFNTDNLVRYSQIAEEDTFTKTPLSCQPRENLIVYQSLNVIKRLSRAKFPVYLAASKVNKQNFAMKLFGHKDDKPHPYFRNEIRFASLDHPNIIRMVHYENQKDTLYKGELKRVSYILMEYALHGDFFDFITKHRNLFDEKLARTYFRQLIKGMEYLHSNGVAHLDLKPENLLIAQDFNLKIADFDLSHVYGDSKIHSRGTRCYRAPEFFKNTSNSDPKIKNPFAADIYSLGVILFIFKSGGVYPYIENKEPEGVELIDLLFNQNEKFWRRHCQIEDRDESYYDKDFRDLVNKMMKLNPDERISLKEIKQSKWYNGPVYTQNELQAKMNLILQC